MTKCDFCIEATPEGKCPVENKYTEKQVYCEDAAARMARELSNQEEIGESDYIVRKGIAV